jgi:archaemetzincin
MICVTSTRDVDGATLATVETCIVHVFGFGCRRLGPLDEPSYALDRNRRQYSSSLILREMALRYPSDATRFLAVTGHDIFIPMLTFVFGQAMLEGKVAIVSSARLDQAFYGLPGSRELTLSRLVKVTVHEMAHTFSLIHCLRKSCPMSLATDVRQLDTKSDEFCKGCAAILRDVLAHTPRGLSPAGSMEIC